MSLHFISYFFADLHSDGIRVPGFLFKGVSDLVRHLRGWTFNKEVNLSTLPCESEKGHVV